MQRSFLSLGRSFSSAIICPPFTAESAARKVQLAEDLWNTKDPHKVAKAYTEDCSWRNRSQFIKGHKEIVEFLESKWQKEEQYRLRKKLFAFTENKIAVSFFYEWTSNGKWYRSYGLEHWTFNENGIMSNRETSINDVPIAEAERTLKE